MLIQAASLQDVHNTGDHNIIVQAQGGSQTAKLSSDNNKLAQASGKDINIHIG